jgi:hypothetical protein
LNPFSVAALIAKDAISSATRRFRDLVDMNPLIGIFSILTDFALGIQQFPRRIQNTFLC